MRDYFISREKAESDVLSCAAFLAERIKSNEGHAEAMGEIVPRFLAHGDVDLAAELSNAVDDPYSRDRLLILIAEKCAETDDDEYALQLADAIEDQSLQADAFERIALTKAHKGDHATASEVAERMAHADFVYAGIAINQAAGDNEAGSKITLDGIEFPAARVFALLQIAAANLETSEPETPNERVVGLLDDAVAAAGEIEHEEERIRVLCDVGNLFIAAKRNDKAIETFSAARTFAEQLDNVHRDLFLVTCSLGFLYAGSDDLAERTLDLVTDKTQMSSALLGFARHHWERDEKDDAVEALEEAYEILRSQRESETRDSRTRNSLMATIAAQFAVFDKSDRGVEIAHENNDPNQQRVALSQIAQVLTRQGKDDLARQTINLIAEDADRVLALIAISDVKNKDDEPTSLSLLDETLELAETVPQLSARSDVLNGIARRYIDMGENDKARATAAENFAAITAIRDESSQAAALAGLAGLFDREQIDLDDSARASLQTLVRKTEW